ncbi:MAG: hypothetical protein RSB50_06100 [Cetobacterium sp.]
MKTCVKCGVEKPIEEFGKNKGYVNGTCKSCINIRSKEWKENNREKVREQQRECRKKYPEKYKKISKENYSKNNEKRSRKTALNRVVKRLSQVLFLKENPKELEKIIKVPKYNRPLTPEERKARDKIYQQRYRAKNKEKVQEGKRLEWEKKSEQKKKEKNEYNKMKYREMVAKKKMDQAEFNVLLAETMRELQLN